MIVVEDIVHCFVGRDGSRHPILAGVSLIVPDGAFVSLLGPTGCGKTTLLRIVQGLLRPTSGTVLIDGRPVLGSSSDRALVFQEFNLLPWRTARANVEFGLEVQGVPAATRRVAATAALEMVGLGPFGGHYPHELSGGMKQRVGLARALCTRPRYLLMDEPFGALDLQTRELMQAELAGLLERQGTTVLFVTHSVDEAIFLSDRIVVLSARPTQVLEHIEIELPRPRANAWRSLRASQAFETYRERTWGLLEAQRRDAALVEVGRWH